MAELMGYLVAGMLALIVFAGVMVFPAILVAVIVVAILRVRGM